MRKNTRIGDVFSAQVCVSGKKYLQYIANDLTQLNGDVIRAFSRIYPIAANPGLSEVVNDTVDFYAHCVTKWGIKYGFWERVGNIGEVGPTDHILFRSSADYGNPEVKVSHNWWVWKINAQQQYVGTLKEAYHGAEIGAIMDPESIVARMSTGSYDGFYPDYE